MSDVKVKTVFEDLYHLDVNEHVEQKNTGKTTLSYLSWAWAWAEVKKRFNDVQYEIVKDPNGLPYFADPKTGIMVYTRVTIQGVTHEMWLPVMDGANNAMKFEPYEIQTRFGSKPVAAATMFDINKTIMRCLVKNLAMFGLGLYIYAGEDLPQESDADRLERERVEKSIAEKVKEIDKYVKTLTSGMDKDAKIVFANENIVPIIGAVNYKSCKDEAKIAKLLTAMESKSSSAA